MKDKCDCNYPECMSCFERRAEIQKKYGADKELYYEYQSIKDASLAEKQALEDCNPEILEEIIKNPNSW